MGTHTMGKVTRFSVSMEPGLLEAFDREIARAGYGNRSRAVGDIVRDYLVEAQWQEGDTEVVGTVTIVYDPHSRKAERYLTGLQHQHHDAIACTTHVHLAEQDCLEVIVVRGSARDVNALAEQIMRAPGVKQGKLVCTAAVSSRSGVDHAHS
jgi:CopG family transcriptional regulator, nickel-responsive regulator